MELVHQRRFDIIEELGAHDVSRSGASPFRDITKRIRELLSGRRLWTAYITTEQESPRIYREHFCLLAVVTSIVQISVHLKSKNALYQYVI